MTEQEMLQHDIVRTIQDYYSSQDDADIYIADELRQLEDKYAAGNIFEDDYIEQEARLISEQNQAENHARYLYSQLEDDFVKWRELTGEEVDLESFEHLLD